jgi:molybdenum cofactor guanylyltransferase
VTSIVLAGGKSLRLGRDKALEEIGGQRLIERVIERLSRLGDDIIVVTASKNQLPDLGVRQVHDCYPGRGALVGIYTGLKEATSSHNLVVACDMPFLNIDLLRYLVSLSPSFDIVIPRVSGEVEPLHAVYSKDCIAPIEAQLHGGRFKLSDLLEAVEVRYVEDEEIDRFDPDRLSFLNINYESDLERARAMLKDGVQ